MDPVYIIYLVFCEVTRARHSRVCDRKKRKTKVKCSFQAEDRVDELSKDLLQIRHRLQATEEEKRGKDEEAVLVNFSCVIMALYNTSPSL